MRKFRITGTGAIVALRFDARTDFSTNRRTEDTEMDDNDRIPTDENYTNFVMNYIGLNHENSHNYGDEVSKMLVRDLKDILRNAGHPVSGSKETLDNRILANRLFIPKEEA
jgi:hypothetical protein